MVVNESDDRTLEPPTTPPKLIAPDPALTVKSLAPLIVDPLPLKITALLFDVRVIASPSVTAPVYVWVPLVVMSPFKVIPVPVIAKVPEVIPTTETAPPEEMVRVLVAVSKASVAVIVPLELRITRLSAKVGTVAKLTAIAPVPAVLPKVILEKPLLR